MSSYDEEVRYLAQELDKQAQAQKTNKTGRSSLKSQLHGWSPNSSPRGSPYVSPAASPDPLALSARGTEPPHFMLVETSVEDNNNKQFGKSTHENVPSPTIESKPSLMQKTDKKASPKQETAPALEKQVVQKDGTVKAFPKKTPLTKAERRELQEAQRAAKAAAKEEKASGKGNAIKETQKEKGKPGASATKSPALGGKEGKENNDKRPSTSQGTIAPKAQYDDQKRIHKQQKKAVIQRTTLSKENQVALFSHLPQYEKETSFTLSISFAKSNIHPSILRLGLKFAEMKIVGSNARCLAMLNSFKDMISDYSTPPFKDLSRDLETKIKPAIQYLTDCRPHSVSMGNAIKYLKLQIVSVPQNFSESEGKAFLIEKVDEFITTRMTYADESIARKGVELIKDGDVIATYARSHVVERTLLQAHSANKKFRVIVVDSRPMLEGKELMKRLVRSGIHCTYTLLNGAAFLMKEVTKVFVGASSMLHNGNLVSRVGTAVVGLVAHSYRIPLIVFCETYKFSERAQLESISNNELGDPDELIRNGKPEGSVTSDWRDKPSLKLLNLMYDLTPIKFINMVITEVGAVPATSVPVIIREYRKEVGIMAE